MVVVGGGFGGVQVVRGLRRAPVEVTLVDRQNFTLFQPLAYQVATGALAAPEIAVPLRRIVRGQENVRVMMAEVVEVDVAARAVVLGRLPNGETGRRLPYDTLVAAGGSRYSYFGHDDWAERALELKSLEGALTIRSRLLTAFEAAEVELDPDRRAAWLTFVVVGGGPTGVEMAGQIAELARDTLRADYRAADTRSARVLLVETADRPLAGFPPSLAAKAVRSLERLGVTPMLGTTVIDVTDETVSVRTASGDRQIPARTVIWAAGVEAEGLAATMARAAGAEVDRAGRIPVAADLTVAGHPELFALGDMVAVAGERPLPGLAPVAMQQGRHVARAIRARLDGGPTPQFHYRDKGNLATIGRSSAVADVKGVHLSGLVAWIAWLTIHLFYLIGFQNRLLVLLRWFVSFVTRGRGARLIR